MLLISTSIPVTVQVADSNSTRAVVIDIDLLAKLFISPNLKMLTATFNVTEPLKKTKHICVIRNGSFFLSTVLSFAFSLPIKCRNFIKWLKKLSKLVFAFLKVLSLILVTSYKYGLFGRYLNTKILKYFSMQLSCSQNVKLSPKIIYFPVFFLTYSDRKNM